MAKRNISYIKPQEPAFLTRLKEQAGYVEKDTVDTKRQEMPSFTEEDGDDKEEEQPTVVVLKAGDLTAEEVELAKAQKQKEEAEAPADLTKRIVFKVPEKSASAKESTKAKKRPSETKHRSKAKRLDSTLLSFDHEDNDDTDES